MAQKWCSGCEQNKDETDFRAGTMPGKLRPSCRTCEVDADRERRKRKRLETTLPIEVEAKVDPETEAASYIATMPDLPGLPRVVGAEMDAVGRWAHLPDVHRPYHDKRAWRAAMAALKAFQPDWLHIAGDFADCYAVSDHEKSANRALNLKDEMDDAVAGLDEIQYLLPNTRVIFTEGNHETRWARYLARTAPQASLFQSNDMRSLLKMDKRPGWTYVPYRKYYMLGGLILSHDFDRSGVNAIRMALGDTRGNAIMGHLHRMGTVYEGDALGRIWVAASFGWLGDFDAIDWKNQLRARREWVHGLGFGYLIKGGRVQVYGVPIINGEVIVSTAQMMIQT